MKKAIKRIVCGALALTTVWSFALERILRNNTGRVLETVAQSETPFQDVTGEFDTTSLRVDNFNAKVSNTRTKRYETRTVMVTLSKKSLTERAENEPVTDFADGFAGEMAVNEIRAEQDAFLSRLSKTGIDYELEARYDTLLNGVAVRLHTRHVADIKAWKGVDSVVVTDSYTVPKSLGATNGVDIGSTGIYDSTIYEESYGRGTVVATLDTGIDYDHPAFATTPKDYKWEENETKALLGKLAASRRTSGLQVGDVYLSEKIPFAYDYADDDTDVYSYRADHGTHVAGILGGYETDGDSVAFQGVLPNAQLLVCKVFSDTVNADGLQVAETKDVVSALEDCLTFGVDAINISLGMPCGFSTTDDGDSEGRMLETIYSRIRAEGVSLICAAGNESTTGNGGVYDHNLTKNPDYGTVNAPSTYAPAVSVASVDAAPAPYLTVKNATGEDFFAVYKNSFGANFKAYDFTSELLGATESKEFEYVVVPATGRASHYTQKTRSLLKDNDGRSRGRIALVERGDTSFVDKIRLAAEMGAIGVIVYNDGTGLLSMDLSGLDIAIPTAFVNAEAGRVLKDTAGGENTVGSFTLAKSAVTYGFISEFSSFGPTPDLKLKPDLAAYGGAITSTTVNGYATYSGTSQAASNATGATVLVRKYIEKELELLVTGIAQTTGEKRSVVVNRLTNQLLMSTATILRDPSGNIYSPRVQGAGLISLANAIGSGAYLSTDVMANDCRPKIEFGADKSKTGSYQDLHFSVTNFSGETLRFKTHATVLTDGVEKGGLTVSGSSYELAPESVEWSVSGGVIQGDELSVETGKKATLTVSVKLSDADKGYLNAFENGAYVEGFFTLSPIGNGKQCELNLPFLGFYGDWEEGDLLDYDAYELSGAAQDETIPDEEKPQAQIFATQPYATFGKGEYAVPMGEYVYEVGENMVKPYADERYNAISIYADGNYPSTTEIQALYAGLLRNARVVKYSLTELLTGRILTESTVYRVGKAYIRDGVAVGAEVPLHIDSKTLGLISNGSYRLDFDFYRDEVGAEADDSFSFSFTVDYEAPVLEKVRLRHTDEWSAGKLVRKSYLDFSVYDNQYLQSLMLCYGRESEGGETALKLATEYPTPVYEPNKNATTVVSIEVTDFREEYKDCLYLQIEDYALNTSLYRIDMAAANKESQPSSFWLAENEDQITLDIYETHLVKLGSQNSNPLNYEWTSLNPSIAEVKNGEIVGLKAGTASIVVSDEYENYKYITVTVNEAKRELPCAPLLVFSAVETASGAIVKPSAENGYTLRVALGKEIPLLPTSEPWYYPMDSITLEWESDNEQVAIVNGKGVVKTLAQGVARITVHICKNGVRSGYSNFVVLRVQDAFEIENGTLTGYNGWGYNAGNAKDSTDLLVLPDGITKIGKNAFADNQKIRRIVIPATVTEVEESAFENCDALESVYFVDTKKSTVSARIAVLGKRAFYGCDRLKTVDFTNAYKLTLDTSAFESCTALKTVTDMQKVLTAYDRAFAGCTSLQKADITNLTKSGTSLFEGCTALTELHTSDRTIIGASAFKDCKGLVGRITLRVAKIGASAFQGASGLSGVRFEIPTTARYRDIEIGANAFAGCGVENGTFTVDFGTETVVSIGNNAFQNAAFTVSEFVLPKGLRTLGTNVFAGTKIQSILLSDEFDFSKLKVTKDTLNGLSLRVVAGSTRYAEENGIVYGKENGANTKILFVNTQVLGVLDLRDTAVTAISAYAFARSGITEVILPETFNPSGLAEGAFAYSALESLDCNGVAFTSLPNYAFAGTKITTFKLPKSVTSIGAYAFANTPLTCIYNLETETVEQIEENGFLVDTVVKGYELVGIKSVGAYAFLDTKQLKEVSFRDAGWSQETQDTATDKNFSMTIGDSAFSGSSVEKLRLPTMLKLGASSLRSMSALKAIDLPDTLTEIASSALNGTGLEEIVIPKSVTTIGSYAFSNSTSLVKVTLPEAVKRIEAGTFQGCTALREINLEAVEYIGVKAFYNAYRLGYNPLFDEVVEGSEPPATLAHFPLKLDSVRYIEADAFWCANKYGVFTSVYMPNVISIGNNAFRGCGASEIVLPDGIEKLGEGAFISALNLTQLRFESGARDNGYYFLEDSVLYRYSNAEKTEYELLYYPTAKTTESYRVIDGTVRIAPYAFYSTNKGAIQEVVLPYSLKSIGNRAFHANGISRFVFESIQAPILEAVYEADVLAMTEKNDGYSISYKGGHYSNFDTRFVHFTRYGTYRSYLSMQYPENGVGYDNFLYKTYFATRTTTGIAMTDDTRYGVELVRNMEDAETVKSWLHLPVSQENTAKINAFAATVRTARAYYEAALKEQGQAEFFTVEDLSKLTAVETQLRAVKTAFGIPARIVRVEYMQGSAKENYLVGEYFDKSGVAVDVYYDDGSIARTTGKALTVKTDYAFEEYDNEVELSYTENGVTKSAYVIIQVTDPNKTVLAPQEITDETLGIVLTVVGGVFAVAGFALIWWTYKKRQKLALTDGDGVADKKE